MTPTQIAELRIALVGDPALAGAIAAGQDNVITSAYNAPNAAGDKCWRTALSAAEIDDAVNRTELIGRSAGERDAFALLLSRDTLDTSRANVRQGFQDIFSGAGGDNTRTALVAAAQRVMTRAERLFATGPVGGAFTCTFEGNVTDADVAKALRG